MLNVLAYIDEPALAEGLRQVISSQDDIELKCISSLDMLWLALEFETPEVLLVNLTPSVGMQTLRTIISAARGTRIVIWLRTIDSTFACETVLAGVTGILRKTLPNDLVIKCIRKVADGELWLEKSIASQLVDRRAIRLTAREQDLVDGLSQGLRNKEIASALNLTEASVKVYVSRLLKKLRLKDRFELGLYGLKQSGSVSLETPADPHHQAVPPATPTRRLPLSMDVRVSRLPASRSA